MHIYIHLCVVHLHVCIMHIYIYVFICMYIHVLYVLCGLCAGMFGILPDDETMNCLRIKALFDAMFR